MSLLDGRIPKPVIRFIDLLLRLLVPLLLSVAMFSTIRTAASVVPWTPVLDLQTALIIVGVMSLFLFQAILLERRARGVKRSLRQRASAKWWAVGFVLASLVAYVAFIAVFLSVVKNFGQQTDQEEAWKSDEIIIWPLLLPESVSNYVDQYTARGDTLLDAISSDPDFIRQEIEMVWWSKLSVQLPLLVCFGTSILLLTAGFAMAWPVTLNADGDEESDVEPGMANDGVQTLGKSDDLVEDGFDAIS